jgi:hypothetical protein
VDWPHYFNALHFPFYHLSPLHSQLGSNCLGSQIEKGKGKKALIEVKQPSVTTLKFI